MGNHATVEVCAPFLEDPNLLSHPTVGVAVVVLANNVPVRLSSLSEELPVSH